MAIKTFGFELEFFVKNSAGVFVMADDNNLDHDHCGYLAEARGEKHEDPRAARHLLQSAIEQLTLAAKDEDLTIVRKNIVDLPREFLRIAMRERGKNVSKAYFAHGGCYRNTKPRAGLHIHFGTERKIEGFIKDEDGEYEAKTWTIVEPLNVPRIIWMLDDAFRKEIKAAKRVLGEYEPKDWGFEYRSLPADIDLDKVVVVLEKIKAENL